MDSYLSCGWFGSIHSFLELRYPVLSESLARHHRACMNEDPSVEQGDAWQNCFDVLRDQFETLTETRPESLNWSLVFEYELPRERGRRPDVVLLAPKTALVLEFKGWQEVTQAFIDQVSAYARDLKHYHAASHNLDVYPILVLTRARNLTRQVDDVLCISSSRFADEINRLIRKREGGALADPHAWVAADYAPLPSLVTAARTIFEHEPLPNIKRAESSGIADTILALKQIAVDASQKDELHLALITGVPGAGKTLVGIQFVYESQLHGRDESRMGVMLSGNSPLVKVLQYALKE